MSHKHLGGWFLNCKLFAQIKIATDLWYDTKTNGERSVYLFQLGWYEQPKAGDAKLFNLTILFLSIQLGFNL